MKTAITLIWALTLSLTLTVSAAYADKTLTIISASGEEKTVTLANDPEVVISYDTTGMRLQFSNINMRLICIEDPSEDGVCRLQAYDGGIVTAPPVQLPGAPSKPSVQPGDGIVTVSWSAPSSSGSSDITGYRILQAVGSSSTFSNVVANTGSTQTSYTVSGLTNGTSYRYRVAAINSEGEGGQSPISDAVTPTAGAGPVDNTEFATACNGLPSLLDCEKIFAGNFKGGFETNVGIPDNSVLVVPMDLATADNQTGRLQFQSFEKKNNFFFDAWFSSSPNGAVMNNGSEYCEYSGPAAEGGINWGKGDVSTFGKCKLPDSAGLVWMNFKFFRPSSPPVYDSYLISTLSLALD